MYRVVNKFAVYAVKDYRRRSITGCAIALDHRNLHTAIRRVIILIPLFTNRGQQPIIIDRVRFKKTKDSRDILVGRGEEEEEGGRTKDGTF